jgi:DNA polymerase III delta prime subunit
MQTMPLFHAETKRELEALATRVPHAFLLYGQRGIGLRTAVSWLASTAGVTPQWVLPEYNEKVDEEKGKITIDVIRRLYDQTNTRVTSPRLVIITRADTMTVEAQHAFLKLLEEPTENTHFVLLCHEPHALLATVRSRVQQFHIRSLTRKQSESFVSSLGVRDGVKQTQLLFMATGLPALLTKLVNDDEYFATEANRLRLARQLIQADAYGRIVIGQSLGTNREDAMKLIEYALRIMQFDIATKKEVSSETLSLLGRFEHLLGRLRANANVRVAFAAAVV